jgi:hypothetical protein
MDCRSPIGAYFSFRDAATNISFVPGHARQEKTTQACRSDIFIGSIGFT